MMRYGKDNYLLVLINLKIEIFLCRSFLRHTASCTRKLVVDKLGFYRFLVASPSLFLRSKTGTTTSDSVKPVQNKPTYLPHVERDTEAKPEQTLCEGNARLMQA